MTWIRNASDELAVSQGCYFDEDEGARPCDFIERFCRQSKGRWAGQRITLIDWQRDGIMRLFGWRAPDGLRRFRSLYLEVAKKNGKSTLMSGLAVYFLVGDGEGAPEIYLNAVDREQASIIFDEAARMVEWSPDLRKRLEVIKSKKRITDPIGHGRIVANSADVPSKDGANASHVIFDELHRQKNRLLWEIFEFSGESREQPLRISITTAGEECEGVWHEQRDYSERVNSGLVSDTTHLGIIYRALDTDDLDDPGTWRKANPSLGVILSEANFLRELSKAREVPAEFANFLRLRLNIVVRGDSQFIDIKAWDACNTLPEADDGLSCWMGLDLSQTQDLSALIMLSGDAERGYNVAARFWLPDENIADLEREHQLPYRVWADQGLITLTPGNVIDYGFIRQEINALASEHDVRKIMADPYNATKLGIELKEEDGLPIEFIRQGYLSLSAPTKELLRLILGRKLRHGGHPILRNHIANAVAEQDAAGNLKLSKRKSKKKIDGAAALVNAIAAATGENEEPSVYQTRGIICV